MGAVLIVLVLGLLALPQAAFANQAACSFSGATVTVTVTASKDFAPSVFRSPAGDILIVDGDGPVDCGTATVTNTDTIAIDKPTAGGLDITYISIRTPFVPGLTDEPGGIEDEIEFVVNFPAGGDLSIDSRVSTSDTGVPLNVTAGGNEVNLNAGEADGVDSDLTVTGASTVTFVPATFDDLVIGSGGAGTPATPFTLPLSICSGLAGGNDTFVGGAADDGICGLGGNDLIDGGGGDDSLRGDLTVAAGNDVLIGGAGDDQLEAQAGDDRIEGGPGDDGAYAGDGNDTVLSGAGRDNMRADAGDDLVVGDGGRDRLAGGEGDDRLRGKKGRDRLKGEEGNDRHLGGPGRDRCIGGPGADAFAGCEARSP